MPCGFYEFKKSLDGSFNHNGLTEFMAPRNYLNEKNFTWRDYLTSKNYKPLDFHFFKPVTAI